MVVWFRVDVDHVRASIVYPTCNSIHTCVDNIQFPTNNEAYYVKLAEGWKRRLRKKYGEIAVGIMDDGVVAAGDGLAMQIIEPRSNKELQGRPSKLYMSRKGYFALIWC